MEVPWIWVEEAPEPDIPAGPGYSNYTWQGLFVCQVIVAPYQDWVKRKWGFNASALVEETLDRQRLFLESQYLVRGDPGFEPPEYRTLAFRFINRPGDPLLVVVIGKIKAPSRNEARDGAMAFYNEIQSIFPYDYALVPACSEEQFLQLSGDDILKENQAGLAQIKRMEVPRPLERNSTYLQGLWQTGIRTHEQVWRSLAGYPAPVVMNVTLRSTILYEKERTKLLKNEEEVSAIHESHLDSNTLSAMKKWNHEYIERRLAPWMKFFYLQIHLVSSRALSEGLPRIIGTSLTLSSIGKSHPGYQVISPGQDDRPFWQKRLRNLDLIFSGSYLPVPRLSEVADLDEVSMVMRLPYSPPEDGYPNVIFGSGSSS